MVTDNLLQVQRRRVAIIDPLPLMRRAIAGVVAAEADLSVAGEGSDPREAVGLALRVTADIVVTDLVFAHTSGFELIRQLRARIPGVGIVVHTSQAFPACVRHCMALGADAFVHKGCDPMTLVVAMRRTAGGEKFLSTEVAREVGAEIRATSGGAAEPVGMLSNREFEVLEGLSRGLSSREIADAFGKSVKTVETYQARIKQKLGLSNLAHLIRFAALHFMGNQQPPASRLGN